MDMDMDMVSAHDGACMNRGMVPGGSVWLQGGREVGGRGAARSVSVGAAWAQSV